MYFVKNDFHVMVKRKKIKACCSCPLQKEEKMNFWLQNKQVGPIKDGPHLARQERYI